MYQEAIENIQKELYLEKLESVFVLKETKHFMDALEADRTLKNEIISE